MSHISISIRVNKSIADKNIIPSLCNERSIIDIEGEGLKIIRLVCERLKISPQKIMHHSRCQIHIAQARQLAMYLLHVGAGCSMSEVGRFFSRDRTTVSHACNKVEDRRDEECFDSFVSSLEDEIETLPV